MHELCVRISHTKARRHIFFTIESNPSTTVCCTFTLTSYTLFFSCPSLSEISCTFSHSADTQDAGFH